MTTEKKIRTKEELIHDIQQKDQDERRDGIIKDITEAETKWKIRVGVEMRYTAQGAFPKISLIDTKGNENTEPAA